MDGSASKFPTVEACALFDNGAWVKTLSESIPVLIWCSGPDGGCTYFNDRWLQFTGRTSEESLGDGWARDLHPEDAERVLRSYYQSLQGREKFRLEYRLKYQGGHYKWIVDFGAPVFDHQQNFLGYVGGCIDVTTIRGTASATSWREKYEAVLAAGLSELSDRIWEAEVAIHDRLDETVADPAERDALRQGLQTLQDIKKKKVMDLE